MDSIKKTHVLVVVGEPVGGIRYHIHSIIKNINLDNFLISYAYSGKNTDVKFKSDMEVISQKTKSMFSLNIGKYPSLRDLSNFFKLVVHVRKYQIVIVHGHGAKGGLYARLLKLFTRIKVVYTPHGGSLHRTYSPALDFIIRLTEKFLYYLTDYVVFESQYSKEMYEKKISKLPKQWTVNFNAIEVLDLEKIRRSALNLKQKFSNGIHIGIFGMLRKIKGQELAIMAFSRVSASHPDVNLHLFGEGSDRKLIKKAIDQSGLNRSVILHGEVNNPLDYIYSMDVILIPSLFESFGYVGLEAALLNKYVIASRTGGLINVLENYDKCVFFRTHDHADLSEKILMILDKLKNQSKEEFCDTSHLADKYSVKNMLQNLEATYAGLEALAQ